MNYTPGPWTAGRIDVEGRFEVTADSTANMPIATVSGYNIWNAQANARLIAKAPDLLNAVQAAADLCEGLLPGLSGLKAAVVDGMRKDFLKLIANEKGEE